MNEELFAERLAQLRTQKGYSARDMSLSLGQSESYINKIENNKHNPSIPMFFIICEYLGISEKDFFDTENKYPERLNELVKDLMKLDEDSLNHIWGLVKTIVDKR